MSSTRVEVLPLPVHQAPNAEAGPKRMMLAQGEFTLLHPACPEIRFLAFLTFFDGVRRGGHYHPGKTEFFYLLKGQITLKTRDRETGAQADFELKGGTLVRIPSNVEHVYIPQGPAEAVEFSATAWSASDTVKVDFA